MADRYLNEEYVNNALGASVVRAIVNEAGVNLTLHIELCTAIVKGYLRANGYTPPSTQNPAELAELMVSEATMGLLRQKLCSMPKVKLPLPESWETHPEKMALDTLRADHKGEAVLNLPLSTVGSVGGTAFTNVRVNPQLAPRASSCQLKGY